MGVLSKSAIPGEGLRPRRLVLSRLHDRLKERRLLLGDRRLPRDMDRRRYRLGGDGERVRERERDDGLSRSR